MNGIDRKAMHERIEIIADVLGLTEGEVAKAKGSEDHLLAFAAKHRQSVDWIVAGEMQSYIAWAAMRPKPKRA